MTVYIDDLLAPLGRMRMCHMVADTSEELHTMAEKIGIRRKWVQDEGTYREHYDVSLGKRALAIHLGAMPVTVKQLAGILQQRRPAS